MRIGYACINGQVGCTTNATFRLKNFSSERFLETVRQNLECFRKILEWNIRHEIFYFRLGSQLIPFASHSVNTIEWEKIFADEFKEIGKYIVENNIRVCMHPDQFVLLNSPSERVHENSVRELEYHCRVLNLLKLPLSAKVQIHVGGVYGEKEKSIERFLRSYEKLPPQIKARLVIENDDRLFSVQDCVFISKRTGVPIVFDNLHHLYLNNSESEHDALKLCAETWKSEDGPQMVDYSEQNPEGRKGNHSESISVDKLEKFLKEYKDLDFDLMLEVKDKERSALKANKMKFS